MSQQESVLSRFSIRPLMDAEPSRFPKVGELILVNFIVGAMDPGSLLLAFDRIYTFFWNKG